MKSRLLILLIAFSVTSCANKITGLYEVELYATNDVHAQFFDTDYYGNVKNTSLSKVSFYINNRRQMCGDSCIAFIDVGDMLQGDAAACFFNDYANLSQHKQNTTHFLTKVMEYMRYDAAVIGNHDFEAGHRNYDRIRSELKIPYLAANAIDEIREKPYFEEYAILNKNNIKIAVIGMVTHHIKQWLDKSLYSGIKFVSPVNIVDSLVNVVRKKESPDIVVIALHSGLGRADIKDDGDVSAYIASHVKGADFVIASHDHIPYCGYFKNDKDSILVINGGCNAEYISKVKIQVKYDNGKVVGKKISGRIIPMSNIPSDSIYNKQFLTDFNEIKDFSTKKVGYLNHDISLSKAYTGYSDYINFINYVMMKKSGADISFSAPIGGDGTIKRGDISFNTVMSMYPYDNLLYTIEMTGTQIKNYLEYSYDKWINTIKSPDEHFFHLMYNKDLNKYIFEFPSFNFDSAKGIIYNVDVTKGFGDRINIISMENGSKFFDDKTYKVAISSYRTNGGGLLLKNGAGIDTKNNIVKERYKGIREIIYDYFKNGGEFHSEKPNWKFIPEYLSNKAAAKDLKLLLSK